MSRTDLALGTIEPGTSRALLAGISRVVRANISRIADSVIITVIIEVCIGSHVSIHGDHAERILDTGSCRTTPSFKYNPAVLRHFEGNIGTLYVPGGVISYRRVY